MEWIFGLFGSFLPIIVVFAIFSSIVSAQKKNPARRPPQSRPSQGQGYGVAKPRAVAADDITQLTKEAQKHTQSFQRSNMDYDQKRPMTAVNPYADVRSRDSLTSTKENQDRQREAAKKKKEMETNTREQRYAYDESYGKKTEKPAASAAGAVQNTVPEMGAPRRKSMVENMGNDFLKYGDQFLKAGDRYLNYKPGGLYSYAEKYGLVEYPEPEKKPAVPVAKA